MVDINQQNEIEELIKEATIESTVQKTSRDNSYRLPSWLSYVVGVLLIVSLTYNLPHFSGNTTRPTTDALDSGKRIGLLTIAENINAYQREHGSLPEKTPSALTALLNVNYKILGANHYELTMPTPDGILALNHKGSSEEIHLDQDRT